LTARSHARHAKGVRTQGALCRLGRDRQAQAERNDLLEVLDDRVGARSTVITSQLPVNNWHAYLNDPTLADAILDRVLHAAHRLELEGESQRKTPKEAL